MIKEKEIIRMMCWKTVLQDKALVK